MNNRFAVGIDIGGTKMAFALVDSMGNTHAEHRLPTHPEKGVDQVIGAIVEGIQTVKGDQVIEGVGIGIPGYVDPVNGVAVEAVNLGWHNVPLAERLKKRLELPVVVQKDVNAALIGEARFGAAQGYRDVVLMTIGTGLGIAFMSNGILTIGTNSAAGELAHAGLNPHGRLCRCGLRGCPEAYISGTGLLLGVEEHAAKYPGSPLSTPDVTTQHILDAWVNGDPLAVEVFDEALEQLTLVTTICVGLLNPQLIILGGGLGLALIDPLIAHLSTQVKQRTHAAAHGNLRFAPSLVASSAVGAAALILT